MIIFQLYMFICTLVLASKDSTSYKLKDFTPENRELEAKRIDRWHRLGIALNGLMVFPWIYNDPINWWKYIIYALLIRLIAFDPAFNYWGGLNPKFLGSTAFWDKLFVKLFGKYGALKKSIMFLILLISSNIGIQYL